MLCVAFQLPFFLLIFVAVAADVHVLVRTDTAVVMLFFRLFFIVVFTVVFVAVVVFDFCYC